MSEFDFFEKLNREESENDKSFSSEKQIIISKIHTVFNFSNVNRLGLFNFAKSKKEIIKIDNPYEMCFAAFYLLEYQGGDYAWLIELCGIVFEIACSMLPWYKFPNFSSQDIIQYQYVSVNTLNYVNYSLWDCTFDDTNDNKLIEETLCKSIYRKEGYVLPQDNNILRKIMFINTASLNIIMELCILVFESPIFLAAMFALLKTRNMPIPFAFALVLLLLFAHRKELHELRRRLLKKVLRKLLIQKITGCREIGFHQNTDIIKSKEEYEKELNELRSIVATQKDELIKLKSLLHKVEKTNENQKQQYDLLKSEYDLNIEELIELRESIYKVQNSSELEFEIQKIDPKFPYYSQKRMLVQ